MKKSDMALEPLRVAVVGLGKMGLLHSSILNVMENVRVVGLCEKSSIVRRIAKKLLRNVRMVDDVLELSDLDLDAIFVTTPIPTHFSIGKTVFTRNIASNFFMEKTLAASFSQAQELCKLVQVSRGVNMVGYMKRYSVTFRKAKGLLERKAIGELTSFQAYAYSSDFAEIDLKSKISGSRGGVLPDLGSHVVDLAVWYFGPLDVASANLHSVTNSSSEDEAAFEVQSSDGLKGLFDISWCKKEYRMPEFGLRILGKEGVLGVNDDKVDLKLEDGTHTSWYRHDLNDSVGFLIGAPEYYREDECFVNSALAGRQVQPDFSEGSKVDKLLEKVRMEAVWK
jgi:predicted dehydrogenase